MVEFVPVIVIRIFFNLEASAGQRGMKSNYEKFMKFYNQRVVSYLPFNVCLKSTERANFGDVPLDVFECPAYRAMVLY